MQSKLLKAFCLLSLAALLAAPMLAAGTPANCAGTFLIEEDGGARDFWTFAADGSFFGTTSTQPLYNFSNQQGSWELVGHHGAKGVLLAFVYNDDNTLLTTARIEIHFSRVGPRCDHNRRLARSAHLRRRRRPLDPSTDTGDPIASDTFSGRRVQANP